MPQVLHYVKLHYNAPTSHVQSSTAPGSPIESKPYPCGSSDQDADEWSIQGWVQLIIGILYSNFDLGMTS
jgi:hypothetical protein